MEPVKRLLNEYIVEYYASLEDKAEFKTQTKEFYADDLIQLHRLANYLRPDMIVGVIQTGATIDVTTFQMTAEHAAQSTHHKCTEKEMIVGIEFNNYHSAGTVELDNQLIAVDRTYWDRQRAHHNHSYNRNVKRQHQ